MILDRLYRNGYWYNKFGSQVARDGIKKIRITTDNVPRTKGKTPLYIVSMGISLYMPFKANKTKAKGGVITPA